MITANKELQKAEPSDEEIRKMFDYYSYSKQYHIIKSEWGIKAWKKPLGSYR